MALATKQLERAFRYNSVALPDPGPQYTIEQVRDLYAATYPEIVSAAVEGPEEKDGTLEYTFRRAVGTKGAESTKNDGGPAFPRTLPKGKFSPEDCARIIEQHSGMSLRDAFALASLQGLIASGPPQEWDYRAGEFRTPETERTAQFRAQSAYAHADAMIMERSK